MPESTWTPPDTTSPSDNAISTRLALAKATRDNQSISQVIGTITPMEPGWLRLHGFAAKCGRRGAGDAAEGLGKVSGAVESGAGSDFSHAQLWVMQQFAGALDPA